MKKHIISLTIFASLISLISINMQAMKQKAYDHIKNRHAPENTSLIQAVIQGELNIVKDFVKKRKAPINTQDDEGYTLLHIATLHNHPHIVDYLLKNKEQKKYIDAQTDEGKTALYIACEHNRIEIGKRLIACGANTNCSSSKLVYHVERIDFGMPDVDMYVDSHIDTYSKTPLHEACTKGHVELTKVLLKNGIPHTSHSQENFRLTRNINNIFNDVKKFRYTTSLLFFNEESNPQTSIFEKVKKILNANTNIDIYLPLTIKQIIQKTFLPVISHKTIKAIIQLNKALKDGTINKEVINTAFDGVAHIHNQISPEQLSAFLEYIVSRITTMHTNDTLFLNMAHAYETFDNFLEIERSIKQDKTDRTGFLLDSLLLKEDPSFKKETPNGLEDVRLKLIIWHQKDLDRYKTRFFIPHAFLGESKLLKKVKEQKCHHNKKKKVDDTDTSLCRIM